MHVLAARSATVSAKHFVRRPLRYRPEFHENMHILSFKHVTLGCTTPDVSGGTMANLGMIFQLRNAGAVRTVNELAEV